MLNERQQDLLNDICNDVVNQLKMSRLFEVIFDLEDAGFAQYAFQFIAANDDIREIAIIEFETCYFGRAFNEICEYCNSWFAEWKFDNRPPAAINGPEDVC